MSDEISARILAVAKELNRADFWWLSIHEWNHYENGVRDPDTMRHVNRYIERAKAVLKAAESAGR